MPIDPLFASYARTALVAPRGEKPPPGEPAGNASGAWETSVEARFQRARRVIDDDRRKAAASSRPPHCCALLNTIADHHIETIASYLTPRDRMNLRHAARRLNHALRADAALDRLTIKIGKVLSPSLLRRALAETKRYPAARPALIAMLTAQVGQFCPPHAGPGLGLVVDAIEELPPEQRARPLAATGAVLRGCTPDGDATQAALRAMEQRVLGAVQRLPASGRGRTLAAVLDAGATVRAQRPAKVNELVAGLNQYPPADRAALLRAVTEQFDHRTGIPDQGIWRALVDLALALPAHCQAEPLCALASHPGLPLTLARERWDHMMDMSLDLLEAARTAIYRGLARTLLRLPNPRCDPDTRQRVQRLNSAIANLPSALQPPVLEDFARNILRAGCGDWWEGVVASTGKLPVTCRLALLRALASGMWRAQWRDMPSPYADTLLEAARELPPEDLAVLLGDFAKKAGTLAELNGLFDDCLALPLALRHWTLAALAAKPLWVLADNARPIAQILLPMIDGMDASQRTPIIKALLQTAFNYKEACREDVPTRHIPAATWKALEHRFNQLPPDCREHILVRVARSVKDPMTPVWSWALQSARKLPDASQAAVLSHLASVPYLTDTLGNIKPVRMVAAAAAALPRHYRALPLWAVQRAKHNADDYYFISYLQCCWSIFRLEYSLPEDDRL